ncbi:hypothetical protein TREMEDRAFT_66059 [Tremella mesenterica DSM 1558]|uniref:uncharacterized protein n=1 Tax=Tremella mesenterica (strain ATCC 24925 / CBS 8224 / DSM 1558 / NBRC 9311 / NRRL Y-6157 / RJB 2259-6 / UBC 559-6) TaxID=578456 RepID=UPI00032C3A22|nr:uncharacterized protein TREMEDRAFT_66059 [Tremella mesenterica DSM 1558]EIW65970.1 hypothetical protein TREMEDRAFT_66059 [Tremella mesenterica DSM 1558]
MAKTGNSKSAKPKMQCYICGVQRTTRGFCDDCICDVCSKPVEKMGDSTCGQSTCMCQCGNVLPWMYAEMCKRCADEAEKKKQREQAAAQLSANSCQVTAGSSTNQVKEKTSPEIDAEGYKLVSRGRPGVKQWYQTD